MAYSKNALLLELAAATGLARAKVAEVLSGLAAIAYREAERGFTVPGICRLKVTQTKESRRRDPKSGHVLLVGAHRVLRATPVKKAKEAVAPRPPGLVKRVEAPAAPAGAPPAGAPPVRPSAAPAVEFPADGSGEILFRCVHCRSMLAAAPAQAGTEGECPFCKGHITVPARDAAPQPPALVPTVVSTPAAPAAPRVQDFITFVCQTCNQEIEAPIDMLGLEVKCPTCGAAIHVVPSEPGAPAAPTGLQKPRTAIDRSAMTIRIDLSKPL